MEVFLETDRLILRKFTDADLDLLFELDRDPEVTRFITGRTSSEFTEEMLQHWLSLVRTLAGIRHMGESSSRRASDFLGWFHLRPEEDRREDEPELGYRFKPRRLGQGLRDRRVLGRSSTRRSPSSARGESSPTRSRSTPHRGA